MNDENKEILKYFGGEIALYAEHIDGGFLEQGEECGIGFSCIILTGNRIVEIWFFNFFT